MPACEPEEERAYTIMVYMNGSDLESENGAATSDLIEMLDSGVDTDIANIVIFTGGAIRWHNDLVPSDECAVWRVKDGELVKLGGVGLLNMGDPETLAGFAAYATRSFPARRYGLILWDHGGGSIAGYGHDELFGNSRLSLSEMDDALARSALPEKMAFIGFDACLMASVEMAVVASRYADYLIASQDLEPGPGWDYGFLAALNADPGMDGGAMGKIIADSYFSYYGRHTDEGLTLSVTRLSEAGSVMDALGALTGRCTEEMIANGAFNTLARRRGKTKSFGNGSRRDNDCDMVDIGDMAANLSDMFPGEAAAVAGALERAVVYERNNSDIELGGLTAYYIYGGKKDAAGTLSTYAELGLSADYTNYLQAFADMMNADGPRADGRSAAPSLPEADDLLSAHLTVWKQMPGAKGLQYMAGKLEAADMYAGGKPDLNVRWPAINGVFVCLDRTDSSARGVEYAVPVRINNRDADIIVLFSESCPDGKIMGSRFEDGYIIQKGLEPINDGDRISFYRRVRKTGGPSADEWRIGGEVIVNGGPRLDWYKQRGPRRYCFLLTDWRREERYTEFEKVPG